MGLQECEHIDFSSDWFLRLGIHAYQSLDRKSAVLYRRADAVRGTWNGDRWCGVLAHQLLFVSMYLPDPSVPDFLEIVEITLRGVSLLRQYVEHKFGKVRFAVAMDANTELSPCLEHEGERFTGGGLAPQHTHIEGTKERERRGEEYDLRCEVEGWMQNERLCASNTFGPRRITWFGYRANAQKKVLDYVLVPIGSEVVDSDVQMLYPGVSRLPRDRLTDHALVRVEVMFPASVIARR